MKIVIVVLTVGALTSACKSESRKAIIPKCKTKTSAESKSANLNLFTRSNSLWPKVSGKVTINVCWMPYESTRTYPVVALAPDISASLALHKQWVKDIVESQWNGVAGLNFTGWQECGASRADLNVIPIDSNRTAPSSSIAGQSYVDAIGSDIRGKNMYLNVFFGDEALYSSRYQQTSGTNYVENNDLSSWFVPSACMADLARPWSEYNRATDNPHRVDINQSQHYENFMAIYQLCLKNLALHEFGHVVGYAHEQYRDDDEEKRRACAAAIEAKGMSDDYNNVNPIYMGDKPLGPFDSESIMSYCRNDTTATLSQEDIDFTISLYGTSPSPAANSSDQPDTSSNPANPASSTTDTTVCP